MRPNASFWQGKRVLLTGHTGFKGAWLALWLERLGASTVGISLPASSSPNLFASAGIGRSLESRTCDIRNGADLRALVEAARPDIVLHLAAQSLVRAGYREPVDTFATNVMGTANLLEALRGGGARVVVMVTTDKVYRNLEQSYPYREDDMLGGHDPYSASKAASEMVISCYRDSFLSGEGVAVASARAGNVIGGGDWSEDRLLPDAIRAWHAGETLQIRRPDAIRPWQHVLEPLAGYLALAERLWGRPDLSGAYNFGPHTHEAATVRTVVEIARRKFDDARVVYGDGNEGPHEAGFLALEIARARSMLGVQPRWALDEAVRRTVEWYRAFYDGGDARALCEADFRAFELVR